MSYNEDFSYTPDEFLEDVAEGDEEKEEEEEDFRRDLATSKNRKLNEKNKLARGQHADDHMVSSLAPPVRKMSGGMAISLKPPVRKMSGAPAPVTEDNNTSESKPVVPPPRANWSPGITPPQRKAPSQAPSSRLSRRPQSRAPSFFAQPPRSSPPPPLRNPSRLASRAPPASSASSRASPRPHRPPPKTGLLSRISRQPQGPRNTASTLPGVNLTVRPSTLPGAYASSPPEEGAPSRGVSFAPKRLLDIENNYKSFVVTDEKFLDRHRYLELDDKGTLVVQDTIAPIAQSDQFFFEQKGNSLRDSIENGDVRDFRGSSEVGLYGGAWRGALKRLIVWSYDEVNALRLTRQLQLFLPFQTGYESYLLGQVIEAFESGRKQDVRFVLTVAFQNRNVSRILVQQMGPRYDFLWHWSTMITWNRQFDAWGQFPLIGITAFPGSENFPSTRNHALASIFRVVLGKGNWLTRVVTRGREGLVTDEPDTKAQNLAAESNGFEVANRNQYGNYVGRQKTNSFRMQHRLPTDESIVRTFVANPMPTMINNGVVHTLRQLAKHWHNMLGQFSGNFAHQRMEQLNPFETLRFHMPVVLLTLSTLRGRNKWDSMVLGPMVRKLQDLKPSLTANGARALVSDLKENIVNEVSGGVALVVDPLNGWLDAIGQAVDGVEEEAQKVFEITSSVEIGIRLGHDLITQVGWVVPEDKKMKLAILAFIRGGGDIDIDRNSIHKAMTLMSPRDKRTLIELVNKGFEKSKPAQLLLGRAKSLLQRELRREHTNETILTLSKGKPLMAGDLEKDEWYWLEEGGKSAVYLYDAKATGQDRHRFVHVDTKFERFVNLSDGGITVRQYIPVAEAISRAQRAFMNIELDHGTKFSYDAFMEFTFLRTALRRLIVISEVTCEVLDNARLNVLGEVQRSNQAQISVHDLEIGTRYYTYDQAKKDYVPFLCEKKYTERDPEWQRLSRTKIVKVPPQNMIVIGGGPTGLTTVLHNTENVLASGGVMKLYESRDAFAKGGATFERAQIVRLDSRWIGMLRYHLGTGFEDVYIPASGETDSHLGNTLPTQGFVEITIKDLENMLHVEVSKMWSKGLIQVHTDSKATYDAETNTLSKFGATLKVDDRILRRVDENGKPTKEAHSWKVTDVIRTETLDPDKVSPGNEYSVYFPELGNVVPALLTGLDTIKKTFTFTRVEGGSIITGTPQAFPHVYPKGTTKHDEVDKIVIESVKKGKTGYVRDELLMKVIEKQKFTVDVGQTHVVEAIGKPHGSKVHFSVTTYEPYGVCCIQGLKVSMGMHNFGEKRWGSGLLDDIRSVNDQNTRVIGDFTKMVRCAPAFDKMYQYMSDPKDTNWQTHFEKLVADSAFPELNSIDPIVPKIQESLQWLSSNGPSFRRQTLQTRFFETGDNYYLGMEFTREYDAWKNDLAAKVVSSLSMKFKDDKATMRNVDRFKGTIMHHLDRLWYDGILEVIREGDVYNPGAQHRVPRLYLINSYSDMDLGSLEVGESFRLAHAPEEKYEVVIKKGSQNVCRNVEGYIETMDKSTVVRREGNLTRGPDGNAESKVSLATFPVGHYVNFRTARLNSTEKGYLFCFIGDEQATPHFMRYSGLTGACINAMLINNFIKQAIEGVPFIDRFRRYSVETNWSNSEVVTRGTGANYGQDGFLRPGFPYDHGVDYMHSKVIEYQEADRDLNEILSRDWKIKMAASMVPRGMELNDEFTNALFSKMQTVVFDKFISHAMADKAIANEALESTLRNRAEAMAPHRQPGDYEWFWSEFLIDLPLDDTVAQILEEKHTSVAVRVDQMVTQVVDYAQEAYNFNERISSELFNQPKAVDSITDDFAVEAQNFANSLTMSAAFTAGALAFRLVGERVGDVFSAILAGFNIAIAFGTMANSARYKIRNEELRVVFYDEKWLGLLKGVFSTMSRGAQDSTPPHENPFVIALDNQVKTFLTNNAYYDNPEPVEFNNAFAALMKNVNDPQAIRAFQTILTTKLIVDTHHVSSYLQEDLVNIYKTLEDMHRLLTINVDRAVNSLEAEDLFRRLLAFQPKLEATLQRGSVQFGFVRRRKLSDWDIVVVLKYFWGLICFAGRKFSCVGAPISTETLSLAKETGHLSKSHQGKVLGRESRDLEALYWATRESEIGSLIFVAGFSVFIASILFTIARIFSIDTLEDVAFWALLASTFGAILATIHLFRKALILVRLWTLLIAKGRTAASTRSRENVRKVRAVTFTQILLTTARLAAATAAAVAIPWSLAESAYGDRIGTDPNLPAYIALGAIGTAVFATVFFFVVEYVVRYNLDPKLGEYVCESFRDELEGIYSRFTRPQNTVETIQVQERETWEYVAREFLHQYRFDAVFAADRFGSILNYIQGGLDPR